MEHRLLEREQQYHSLCEYHPDAVFVLDRQGNLLSTNPALQRITGYSEQQLAFLRQHRCEYIQGYLFSHPLPANKMEQIMVVKNRNG
jgi:PAS domain-containing protein